MRKNLAVCGHLYRIMHILRLASILRCRGSQRWIDEMCPGALPDPSFLTIFEDLS